MSKKPNTTSHTEEISGSDAQQEDSAGNEDIGGAEEPKDSTKHRTLYDNI